MERQKISNIDLWKKFKKEKNKARKARMRKKLVEIYYPLVQGISYKVAKNLKWKVHPEELASFGVDGLFVAIERFSLDVGVDFSTYAKRRISGSMIDGIRKEDMIPRSVRSNYNLFNKTKSELEAERGRQVNEFEIVEELGIDQREFLKNTKKYKPVNFISIEGSDIYNPDKQENFKQDSLSDIRDKALESPINSMIKKEFLNKLISKNFSKIEQKIIYLYYYRKLTMEDIAKRLNLSESRVSQLHTNILPRLKNKIKRNPNFFKEDISKYLKKNKKF